MKKIEMMRHGSLFAIPLWHDLGFLYGKMLFGSEFKNLPCRKKEIFIRVYDYYTEEIQKDFKPDFFKDKELFVDPFLLFAFPKLRGSYKWHFLRYEPIFSEDEYIPHFLQVDYFDSSTVPDDQPFWVLKYGNINNPDNEFFPYSRVKHLPIHRGKSYDAIGLYLSFEWLRRNGKNPDDYFEYNPGLDVKKEIKFEVFNMAVDYRTIPKELRGRVAPEK